jgi:hypothetical protein
MRALVSAAEYVAGDARVLRSPARFLPPTVLGVMMSERWPPRPALTSGAPANGG